MTNEICTSIEQSKKLIELGIDVNTADMWYPPTKVEYGIANEWREIPSIIEDIENTIFRKEYYIPSWSLSALLSLIPHTDFDGIELNNYNDGETIWTANFHWKNEHTPIRIEDNPLNAIFEIIVWLLENKKI